MTNDTVLRWLPFAFPLFFAAMWLLSTTLIGLMSGWFGLQQWYADDGNEEPLLKLRGQSGLMGRMGARLNGMLTLGACRSGLSLRVPRFFAPFQKPLLIPWGEIKAEESKSFFTPMVKLSLGDQGTLKISASSWSRLIAAARPATEVTLPSAPAIGSGSVARGLFFEWLVITVLVGALVTVPARLAGGGSGGLPLALGVAIPAIIVAIAQLIRFAKLS